MLFLLCSNSYDLEILFFNSSKTQIKKHPLLLSSLLHRDGKYVLLSYIIPFCVKFKNQNGIGIIFYSDSCKSLFASCIIA